MPMGAAAHGALLLVTERNHHRVCVLRRGRLQLLLAAATMRQPSAVATDGRRAFVAGTGMVHAFELGTGRCIAAWPTASAGGQPFECEHGLAWHRGELYVVDQRGAQVHVFSERGAHLRSFGGPGAAPGRFVQPWGVAACGEHVVVSEHAGRRVQAFTTDGEVVGQCRPPHCGDLAGLWAQPTSAASDAVVLVADWGQRCVHALRLRPWYPSPTGE